jgi:membrane protease YdiL (CAAX protease family)
LRRDIPEPLIALLCFVLGIWLWDHYVSPEASYAPGTEQAALIRIDRDLRLAEAMAEDPPLLRWLAHAGSMQDAVDNGISSLETLGEAQPLSPAGYNAYAVLLATREERPVADFLNQLNLPPPDPESRTWWAVKIRSEDASVAALGAERTIRTRAVLVGSIIWGLGILGLAFVPLALRCLAGAFHNKPSGYTAAWSPSLGLMIFLVATLAWIGFSLVLEVGIGQLPGLHPVAAILLDTAARILPAAIALALLFRKVSHVPRSIGLNGHIHPPVLLGLFALLVLVDQPLRWALGRFSSADPTGGLSYADSGMFGLVFLIISACLIAPIAEEVLYRGILYRSLSNKMGVLAGAAISSVIFASLHFYDFYGLASVAVFGFVCALLYQSTGSLLNVVALHMLYNTALTLPQWTIYHAPL